MLIIGPNGLLTDLTQSTGHPLHLLTLLNPILGINQVSIMVIGIDQGVHGSLILLKFRWILKAGHCHSKGVVENVVVVSEVINVSSDHRRSVVAILVVILVSQSDQFVDLAAGGAPL
jgi:hypothetical protein